MRDSLVGLLHQDRQAHVLAPDEAASREDHPRSASICDEFEPSPDASTESSSSLTFVMETTPLVNSSHPSVASPDGLHAASLNGNHLCIRRISSSEAVRTLELSQEPSRFLCLRWAPARNSTGTSDRFLLADENSVRVWDLHDVQWSATIDNGSGGMGKIANVEFGFDDTEILVFSSFGAQVTSWNLWTGRSVEIKDPKFTTKGYGHNRTGDTGIFALLSRPSSQDMISLHCAGSYEIMKSFPLPSVDAQGLRWSPDGRWIAIWDTPRTGYKVYINTADGHHFRTYAGDYFDDDLVGLGVKTIEWSPGGDFLAVGGYESTVTLLSTRTFSPAIHLSHPNTLRPHSTTIFVEQVTSPTTRAYLHSMTPITPPTAIIAPTDNPSPKIGTSILTFNATGTLLATKSDAHPTTVWIFDLCKLQSRAVLVQHAVVKRLAWHPTDPDLLLIQGIQGEPLVYLWDAKEESPRVYSIPFEGAVAGKAEAKWIHSTLGSKPLLQFGDANGCVFAYPYGREAGAIHSVDKSEVVQVQQSPASNTDDEDSLFDILSGKKSSAHDPLDRAGNGLETQNGTLDDTFRFKQGVSAH